MASRNRECLQLCTCYSILLGHWSPCFSLSLASSRFLCLIKLQEYDFYTRHEWVSFHPPRCCRSVYTVVSLACLLYTVPYFFSPVLCFSSSPRRPSQGVTFEIISYAWVHTRLESHKQPNLSQPPRGQNRSTDILQETQPNVPGIIFPKKWLRQC